MGMGSCGCCGTLVWDVYWPHCDGTCCNPLMVARFSGNADPGSI
jgi:hypothetical protein